MATLTDFKILANRYGKLLFCRLRLDLLFGPFSGLYLKLAYMSRLSRWRSLHPRPAFLDDGSPRHLAEKRFALYEFLMHTEGLDGAIDYLEFGVFRGRSLKWWVEHNRHPESRFVGFDTFTGLPEAWGGFDRGAFSTEGKLPDVEDDRCRFEAGLFQETLGPFMESYGFRHRKVIHLDADLYSATLFVLTRLAPVLEPGDILLFDEFGVPTHEFRAFTDFVSAYGIRYDVLGAANGYLHVAIKLV